MSGTLYVVATPIGNLEDITLRALRVLREAAVIAAEDTRRTAKLLNHHGIRTPAISFHAHNTARRVPELVGRLRAGDSVALVSDAGTPLLSDPGLEIVRECVAQDLRVEPVPGASAPLAALVASGFPALPVTIFGFPPVKAYARKRWFEELAKIPHTVVFLEAPHRIRPSLQDAGTILGNRPLVVARELTKMHQEILRGTAAQVGNNQVQPRGEFTIVVGPGAQLPPDQHFAVSSESLAAEFGHLINSGSMSRRQAIAALARKHSMSARAVYSAIEAAKKPLP